MPLMRALDCGHYVRVEDDDGEPCPYCADYDEARALDVEAAVFEGESGSVVPHVRQ